MDMAIQGFEKPIKKVVYFLKKMLTHPASYVILMELKNKAEFRSHLGIYV